MKILMCLFRIQDYGGIINHAEHMIYGLQQLGHVVDLVLVEDKDIIRNSAYRRKATNVGHSGLPYDQRSGWQFPTERRIAFRSTNWRKYTSVYDLVLWEIPVPSFKTSGFRDNWYRLYEIKTPQVAIVHDGNAAKLYPHIMQIASKLEFIACVHPCAVGNMKALGLEEPPLIVNPQIINKARPLVTPRTSNRDFVISLQTFKRWKRVDKLIRAAPYIEYPLWIAGGGIEYYYMTSANKRKPEYGCIWEEALEVGMEYFGYIGDEEVTRRIRRSKFLVDCSWSKEYIKYGATFNRVTVDAIINGAKPVLDESMMYNNGIFTPHKHYVPIPTNAEEDEFAEAINKHRVKYNDMLDAQKIVSKLFKAETVAKKLLST